MNEHTDFFISYTGVDVDWAEWMAGILEQVGYTTVLQARDFRPGSDFVHEMQQATSTAERTIAILSPAYFGSRFGEAEWRAAFFKDPTGELGLLVPVRVQDCEPPGLLATRVYIDLVGLPEKVAAERLRTGVSQGRAKRFDDGLGSAIVAGATAVPFPGGSSNSRRRTRRLAVAAMAIAAVSVMAMIARGVIDEPLGGRSDPPSASKVHCRAPDIPVPAGTRIALLICRGRYAYVRYEGATNVKGTQAELLEATEGGWFVRATGSTTHGALTRYDLEEAGLIPEEISGLFPEVGILGADN